jgi:hypothetical protein
MGTRADCACIFDKRRRRTTGGVQMLTKTMIALGFIGAMAAATATPSLAQGVYFEGPGFGVGVGRPAYRDRDYRYRAYNYVPRDRYRHGCRTVTIERDDGSVRRIRRCD